MLEPLHDDPADPDTGYSQSEDIQDVESVLVLRTAKSLILPLRIPALWKQQPPSIPARTRSIEAFPIVPFKAITPILEPGTQHTHTLTLTIEPSIDDAANLFLQSDSIRNEGGWRASLYRGSELRASIPFAGERVELHRGLCAGTYTVKLTSADSEVLPALTISLAPFNLPEALQAGETYLASRHYIRAAAVLGETAERYPENADVQDLLVLAHTLASADPDAGQAEQAEFGVVRSAENWTRQASRAFQAARLKFGERFGTLIAGRTLDASAVSDAALAQSAEAMVSTAVLRSLLLLKEKLEVQKSTQNEPLLRVLGVIASHREHLDTLNSELSRRLEAVRSYAQATDDERFALAEQLLQRYMDEIAESRIASPDYKSFFREQLGEACWNWIGVKVQRVFNTAEDLYRYQEAKPTGPADFTPPVLEICRGLEDLLNDKLGASCRSIQNSVNRNSECRNTALTQYTEKTLREVLKPERSMSMWQIGIILRLGRLIHAAWPNELDPKLGALLAFSPGPADIEQVVFLSYIAAELRNGKVHTAAYTSPRGIRLARKLVLGIDEVQVGHGSIRNWIKTSRFKNDSQQVYNRFVGTWAEFPGIVPILWRALEATTAGSADA